MKLEKRVDKIGKRFDQQQQEDDLRLDRQDEELKRLGRRVTI